MMRSFAATLSLVAMMNSALACTAVDIIAADKTVIAGRTMEWAFDMKWTLVSRPKGTDLTLAAPKALNLPTIAAKTKYAVVGVSANIIPGGTILEGQNSAGLGMSGNFLPGFTQYQTVTATDKNYVELLTFGSWALGNFATVAELREALKVTKVWSDPSIPTGPTPPEIHFVFNDRSGAGIVVEYVNGAVQISDNVAHVLTNAPTYDWHLTNLRNYLNLSTVGVSTREVGTANVTAIGQGGGFIGMPGDYTPPSRFVRASALRHVVPEPKTGGEAFETVAHVLNNVDIPIGAAQSKLPDGSLVSDYTQWVSLKDLTHNTLKIADYNHRLNYLTIDLNALFAQDKPSEKLISDLPYPNQGPVGADVLKP